VIEEIQTNVLLRGTKAIRIVRILAALAILLLCPQPAYANPLTTLKGVIHLRKHGFPYREPTQITLHCYWGNDDYKQFHSSAPIFCLSYECTAYIFFSYGTCDLIVETLRGEKLIFDRFLNDTSISSTTASPGLWRNFEATVDVGTGTHGFGKPEIDGLPINSYQGLFVAALLLTTSIENLTLLTLKHNLELTNVKTKRLLLVGSIASLVTLPCLWFLLPQVSSLLPFNTFAYCIVVAEVLVIIVEAGIYYRALGVRRSHAILLSFSANVLSFLAGALLL
jgi:hypothetical protein